MGRVPTASIGYFIDMIFFFRSSVTKSTWKRQNLMVLKCIACPKVLSQHFSFFKMLTQPNCLLTQQLEYWSTQSTVNRKRRQLKKHPCRENNLCKLVVLEGRSGEHRIINLSLMTHYNVSLRGFNSAGEGPRRYSMFHTAFPISK